MKSVLANNLSHPQWLNPLVKWKDLPLLTLPHHASSDHNFELNTHLIRLIERNQFEGRAIGSSQDHLSHFLEKFDTIFSGSVSESCNQDKIFPI